MRDALPASALASRSPCIATRWGNRPGFASRDSNSHFGVVARPSRLRVWTASRRSMPHGAGSPVNSQARTPALHQKNCRSRKRWRRFQMRELDHDLLRCFDWTATWIKGGAGTDEEREETAQAERGFHSTPPSGRARVCQSMRPSSIQRTTFVPETGP